MTDGQFIAAICISWGIFFICLVAFLREIKRNDPDTNIIEYTRPDDHSTIKVDFTMVMKAEEGRLKIKPVIERNLRLLVNEIESKQYGLDRSGLFKYNNTVVSYHIDEHV